MNQVSWLLGAALLAPLAAHAASSADLSGLACSGQASFSVAETASLVCAGDFSVLSGRITSDVRVTLEAAGSLTLDNLSIRAPVIELRAAGGALSIGSGVTLDTRSFSAGQAELNAEPIDRSVPRAEFSTSGTGAGFVVLAAVGSMDAGFVAGPQRVPADRPAGSISLNNPAGVLVSGSRGGAFSVASSGAMLVAGSVTLVSVVPEPDAAVMGWVGLAVLAAGARMRSPRRLRPSPAG